jgi:hypothetical protein
VDFVLLFFFFFFFVTFLFLFFFFLIFEIGETPFVQHVPSSLVRAAMTTGVEYPTVEKTKLMSDAEFGLILRLTDKEPSKRPLISKVALELKEMSISTPSEKRTGILLLFLLFSDFIATNFFPLTRIFDSCPLIISC